MVTKIGRRLREPSTWAGLAALCATAAADFPGVAFVFKAGALCAAALSIVLPEGRRRG